MVDSVAYLFAICFFYVFTTAVATVPITARVVIVVITISVTLILFLSAFTLGFVDARVCFCFWLVIAVETFAILTKFLLICSFVTTAVTAIPVTSAHVILIVTAAVT